VLVLVEKMGAQIFGHWCMTRGVVACVVCAGEMPAGRPRGGRTHVVAPAQLKTNNQIKMERWTTQTIGDECRDQLGMLQWLAARRLISNTVQCPTCGQPATLYRAATCSDGYTWRCLRCLFHRTIRAGSFFQRSHLPL